MPVTPTGVLSLPMANLRALIAHCDAWRDWVGGADGRADLDVARSRVHLFEPPPPAENGVYTDAELEELRPMIVLNWFDPANARQAGTAFEPVRIAQGTYRFSGMLSMELEDRLASDDAADISDARLTYMNRLGALIVEMGHRGQIADYLDADEIAAGLGGLLIRQFSMPFGIARVESAEKETQGDFISGLVVCEIGR